jgi:wobble nucleotide-excising tRNase
LKVPVNPFAKKPAKKPAKPNQPAAVSGEISDSQRKEIISRLQSLRAKVEKKPLAKKETASVLEVVQSMRNKGEKPEKIEKEIVKAGVSPEKAKRLVVLGQADSFALLRQDIANVVDEAVEKSKVELRLFLADQATEEAQRATAKVKEGVKAYEKLGEDVREKVNALTQEVKTMHEDLEYLSEEGIPANKKVMRLGLTGIGALLLLGVLAKFVLEFSATLTIDSVILTVVMGLVGVVAIFLASQM